MSLTFVSLNATTKSVTVNPTSPVSILSIILASKTDDNVLVSLKQGENSGIIAALSTLHPKSSDIAGTALSSKFTLSIETDAQVSIVLSSETSPKIIRQNAAESQTSNKKSDNQKNLMIDMSGEDKKVEAKKSSNKKIDESSAENIEKKKMEGKKSETKKQEQPKVEEKIAETKKSETKKQEQPKLENQKVEAKKSEIKKEQKVEEKQAETKKSETKKQEQAKVEEKKIETKKSEPKKTEESAAKVVLLSGGLQIKDVELGRGNPVSKGKKIGIRYQGMLTNGKVFDSNMPRGSLLNFVVGNGEVIKGMEQGVIGMNVGGTRRIVIPSHLAYGATGAPPTIPPNATLIFDVEVVRA